MSGAARDPYAERRAALIARAARERAELGRMLAPLGAVDRGLERLTSLGDRLPSFGTAAGLGLSALLLALPVGKSTVVRRGIAALQLARSVGRLLLRR